MTTESATLSPLVADDVVQYRKVGTARLVSAKYPHELTETGGGWWWATWIKAPKRERERDNGWALMWVDARDRITS